MKQRLIAYLVMGRIVGFGFPREARTENAETSTLQLSQQVIPDAIPLREAFAPDPARVIMNQAVLVQEAIQNQVSVETPNTAASSAEEDPPSINITITGGSSIIQVFDLDQILNNAVNNVVNDPTIQCIQNVDPQPLDPPGPEPIAMPESPDQLQQMGYDTSCDNPYIGDVITNAGDIS